MEEALIGTTGMAFILPLNLKRLKGIAATEMPYKPIACRWAGSHCIALRWSFSGSRLALPGPRWFKEDWTCFCVSFGFLFENDCSGLFWNAKFALVFCRGPWRSGRCLGFWIKTLVLNPTHFFFLLPSKYQCSCLRSHESLLSIKWASHPLQSGFTE